MAAEQLPKGVGVVPDWWLACTPHNVRSPIDVDKQRRKRTTHEQMLAVRSLLDEVVADGNKGSELGGDLSNEDLLKQQSMRKLQVDCESKQHDKASSSEPFPKQNDADPTRETAAAVPNTHPKTTSSHILVTMTSEEERADVEANRTKSVKQHIGPELLNTSSRSNKRQLMSSSLEEKSSDENSSSSNNNNNNSNNNNKSLMVVSTVVTANSGGGGISSHSGGAYYNNNKARRTGNGGVVPKKGKEEDQDNKSPRIIVTMTSAEEAAAVEANQFVPHTEKFGPEILRKTNHHHQHEQKTGKENGVATSNGVSPRQMAQEEEEDPQNHQQTSVNADANQESSDGLSRPRNPLGFLHQDNNNNNNNKSSSSSSGKSYKTSFTGASPFDFAMQQKAREKERRAKERIYKESLAQHHGHSVEVDKAAKLLAKEREQRRKKKEAKDNLQGFKIDLVADATFNKAAELRRLNQEDKRKKKEAEEMRRGHKFQPSINQA